MLAIDSIMIRGVSNLERILMRMGSLKDCVFQAGGEMFWNAIEK